MTNIIDRTISYLQRRKRAFQLVFGSREQTPAQSIVLEDLAKFCRVNEEVMSSDPQKTAYLAGRRSVFLRISQHLHLSPEQLMFLYGANSIAVQGEE